MLKKTLYFENPAYLSLRLGQLIISVPEEGTGKKKEVRSIPIEDIGIVVLDSPQLTITHALMACLIKNNCALISCSNTHMPTGLLLSLYGNNIQNERFRAQVEASLPLKKQLWQQTIQCKISNQSVVLDYATGLSHENMRVMSKLVRSGDADNVEGRAAAYYWKNIFPNYPGFTRGQDGDDPNALLNYGYAIIRAVVARAIVAGGLIPTLGIHHHNRYNAYCLADDIIEPYRPYVDKLVVDIIKATGDASLSASNKIRLLGLSTIEVIINGKRSPLMVAASITVSSLVKCFSGVSRKLVYPEML